jgi:hypothetical protein
MSDYYKNLTEIDLNDVLPLNVLFSTWDTYFNDETKDLYFVGIKKNKSELVVNNTLKKYTAYRVINTTSNISA